MTRLLDVRIAFALTLIVLIAITAFQAEKVANLEREVAILDVNGRIYDLDQRIEANEQKLERHEDEIFEIAVKLAR